jgi:hypothetical protein
MVTTSACAGGGAVDWRWQASGSRHNQSRSPCFSIVRFSIVRLRIHRCNTGNPNMGMSVANS